MLATVLFTDIVGSTERAARARRPPLAGSPREHHGSFARELDAFRGREVDTAGDGFLATFDGPARAIRCAQAIRDAVQRLGLDVRAGLHTGECEVVGDEVAGIAVHIGARVAASAAPGEVLVSGTVKDLVAGSGLASKTAGLTSSRGCPGSGDSMRSPAEPDRGREAKRRRALGSGNRTP